MRSVAWVLACLGLTVPRLAHAQPQDDAALAEEPAEPEELEERPKNEAQARLQRKRQLEAEMAATLPLTSAEMRQAYPDLEIDNTPHVKLGIFLGALVPFQVLGFGLSTDIYVAQPLRLSGFTSLGITPGLNNKPVWNAYAEVGLGFVLAQWMRETTVKLPVRVVRPGLGRVSVSPATEDPVMRRGTLPVAHSLKLEAGMISGYYGLWRCTADCENPDFSERTLEGRATQLAVPFAGVRYVYYRWARSLETPFRSVQRFQFAADVVTRPINDPEPGLLNVRGKVIKQSPVGARFIFKLPGFQKDPNSLAASLDFTVGYFPSPSDLILLTSFALF